MKKHILEEKVYYYEDAVENLDQLMSTLAEIEQLDKENNKESWDVWTSSNNKDFIYGKTKSFDLTSIKNMEDEYKEKMQFVYDSITKSFYNVCKDYAVNQNDYDEPKLFPSFNIKIYNTGIGMGPHFDQLDGDKTLRYSLVMYLNDDCEGGEISFTLSDYDGVLQKRNPDPDYEKAVQDKTIDFGVKPKRGSVIIFPSSAPYHHTAHLVKSGVKYMVPGHWIHNDMEFNRSGMM
jgi:hypothetical protein